MAAPLVAAGQTTRLIRRQPPEPVAAAAPVSLEEAKIPGRWAADHGVTDLEARVLVSRALYARFVDGAAGTDGRWIPTKSVDQYAATLATWYGAPSGDLPVILPYTGRFASSDLGFFTIEKM